MARKILLADDSVTAQNMGRKILADAGYEVITVNNGSAALKKVTEHKPDLIVLDVYMPGYSGLEVCQRLKEAGDTSHIPVLLTVGKLEPFKPEEAKRVRADAFIVKPFEASELLSALSKLEDKIVPRSEHSKPGRFARATAAIDEGRFDRSMAVEEDSSWKSRIAFPKKKEKEPEQQDVDDPAVYNPVNKDLRTVVEQKPEEHPAAAPHEPEEERINVSALAPEGLPKDVTPEEIAALAAAAAQVKGKIAEESTAEAKPSEETPEVSVAAAEPVETKAEVKEQAPTAEIPAPAAASIVIPEQEKSEPALKEAEIAPSASEVTAAIAGLEGKAAEDSKESGNGAWVKAEEPATMAAAAAAGANGSRWTAVAVALTAEEASLSLEQEMQQAASFAVAAQAEPVEIPARVAEPVPATVAMVEAKAPVAESAAPLPEASAATLPVEEVPVAPVTPTFAEVTANVENMTSAGNGVGAAAVWDAPAPVISVSEPEIEHTPAAVPDAESTAALQKEVDVPAQVAESVATEAPKPETEPIENRATEDAIAPSIEPGSTEEHAKDRVEAQEQVATPEASAPAESSKASGSAREEAADMSAASDSESRIAGGREPMRNKESEVTDTTAAAWASWRKIRDTGDSKPAREEIAEPKDEAAKAVAAGSENNPEEASELDSDPEIANIVDSVLADMRPKIVQEIAKKLGKKK